MRLIYEPGVKSYDPLGDGISRLQYIDHMGNDMSIVNAARVSYHGDYEIRLPGENNKLLKYLIDHRHTSPLEHTAVTFMVECPIFVARQWHRHRIASYNEISRRYTSEDLKFYNPKEFRAQDTKNKQGSMGKFGYMANTTFGGFLRTHTADALSLYEYYIDKGVARELARMVLPQNLYTRFYYTANLHSILHFWQLRSDPHAQEEIRVYSDAISKIMTELYPVTWGYATKERD